MERSVRTLFLALVTVEVLTFGFGLKDFRVDESTLAQGTHLVATRRTQKSLAREWRPIYHHADGDKYVDCSARNRRRNLREQKYNGNPIATEVEALMAFKAGITRDPHRALSSWNSNDSTPCKWMGVTCLRRSNKIVALQLDNHRLRGTISPLLGTLTFLQHLNLSANSLHGSIPTSLLNCSRLTYLALRDNLLGGTMPSQLDNLRDIQYLDLSNNDLLGGTLSASVGNCSHLEVLHLDWTVIGGEIPPTLGRLAHLKSLNLSVTQFTGTIPKSLGNCSALTFLGMGNLYVGAVGSITTNLGRSGLAPSVYLSGELPAELGQLTHLVELGVLGADIEGVFPSWIANLTSLKQIAFVNCLKLTGEIPDFLGRLPSLELLALSNTNFTGGTPKALSNCSNMWFLAIEHNSYLGGIIPPELGLLRNLGALSLTQNNLVGTIPSSISNCSRLRGIIISDHPSFDPQPFPAWVASLVNLTDIFFCRVNLVGEIPAAVGQVSKLHRICLQGNKLRGRIPASLGNCTSLIILVLTGNQLTGEIPSEIWNLPQVQRFDVSENNLSGAIPESIGNWSQAFEIAIAANHFSGEVPSQLGILQNLQKAYFDTNNFNAPIPFSIGNCSALVTLTLNQNRLTGSIPSSIGNLTTLQELTINENLLDKQIPLDLMRCTQLFHLDMSQNSIDGSIPEEIGHLVLLQTLALDRNLLSGVVPHSLRFCLALLVLDISSNNLSSSIPADALANLALLSLDVSQNFLSGSLPEELGALKYVTYLNFSGNRFLGSIPSSLGRCDALESLDLSMNNLSGGIPPDLGKLFSLIFINLSSNHLEGPLPDGGIFNSGNLSPTWFLGNPGLCGHIFLKGCPASVSQANASDCSGFHCHRGGVVATSIGVAVALIILGLISNKILSKQFCHTGCFQRRFLEDRELHNLMGLTLSDQDLLRICTRPENIIGVGERSTVYKEVLPEGKTIAIKIVMLGEASDDGYTLDQAKLHRETQNLSYIRHRNIVKVLGFTSSQRSTALCMEYMPNGSLHNQLHDFAECVLSWETRLNIAVGVAEGLFYLHSQAHEPIIHRDLKPGNILLDEDMVPKLADFGISRYVSPKNKEHGDTTVSKVCGTIGYIPPEYGLSTRVSTKGDVYSYGVVLLELLTRKHAFVVDNDIEKEQPSRTHIVDWILEVTQSTSFAKLDPVLLGIETTIAIDTKANEREQMKLLLQVSLLCTQTNPNSRPMMSDVLSMLRQIQEIGLELPRHPPSVEELVNEISDRHAQNEEPPTESICG